MRDGAEFSQSGFVSPHLACSLHSPGRLRGERDQTTSLFNAMGQCYLFLSSALLRPKTLTGLIFQFSYPLLAAIMRISLNLLTITSTRQSRHPGRRGCHCQLTSSSALSPSLVSTHLASASRPPFFQQTGRHFSPALRRALSCRRMRVASALYGLRFSTDRMPLLASSLAGSLVSTHASCVGML